MKQIISSSCGAIHTTKHFHKSLSHSSFKFSFKLTFIISLILLSTLIEAVPTPTSSYSTLDKRNDNISKDDLSKFANFAAAAYCDTSVFKDWNCGPLCDATNGTVVNKFFTTKNTATRAYIATYEEEELIVVSFRGTVPDNIKTVLTDAKLLLRDYPPVKGAKVHTGFYEAFLEAQSEVFDEVQKLHEEHPNFKVLYTGHSLGAALTLLAALDLVQNSTDFKANENLFVATYGEPRVGDLKFSKFVDSKLKVTRVVNGGDPVPHLPPKFLSYEHPSGELWISDPKKSSSEFITCKGPEDPKCSNSLPIIQLNAIFHMGPYFGVSMRGCKSNNDKSVGQLLSGLKFNKLEKDN
ncbi:alpha/beta-hydrolase [Rhizophagus irregularis]|uniref:Alpha/Beta hydrolase protein n=3 Tax=Rhizophagus irregularis TaxID=588596 RepID=U9SZM9_RHIID|nr:Alpha/Beta hydrolase protein [Rhizophagus irregularis DAOM 181602=DAOM 197198]EXX75127.1 putative lipase [Rhizophagus irregularis DAOM 197198w]PKC12625.1 alpha/beta-hydrolase [Rhizophagus irregularis]PKC74739.1 alpha/beta-hydrolase [Rhizophagus irregularis]PKY12689.1 alpha/beta-hydrolase [Rhizophagus irregularis]POG61205.1 Alpha/Beta hydrolase protein [Rhizophagus irregularis DAOM 181602=DAOM 197198]|eukprot:XP_025168071.1 Alpha/Beta hydrolase protein [Rhizophagus irregularis DAOM 181602=DAOM 197198]